MEEILNISGKQYRISAENVSLQQWNQIKAEQIRKLQVTRPMSLAPATCPVSIVQGSTHTFNVTATGTEPFRYELYDPVLGVSLIQHLTKDMPASFSFTYNFPQALGSNTYRLYVWDSCPTGELMALDQCTLTITAPVCPAVSCTFNLV